MSKRKLVITAVLAGQSQSEGARTYGVSQSWISRLMSRYHREGEAAFEALSWAPKSSPNATPRQIVKLDLQLRQELTETGYEAGPETISWHLKHHHKILVSRATIARLLTKAGMVTWQSDLTHYPLTDTTIFPPHRHKMRARGGKGRKKRPPPRAAPCPQTRNAG